MRGRRATTHRDATRAGCPLACRAGLGCTGRSPSASRCRNRARHQSGVRVVNTRVRSRDAAAWRSSPAYLHTPGPLSFCMFVVVPRHDRGGALSAHAIRRPRADRVQRACRLGTVQMPQEATPARAGTTSRWRTRESRSAHGGSPGSDAGPRAALQVGCQADDCPQRAYRTYDRTQQDADMGAARVRPAIGGLSVQGCTSGPMVEGVAATHEKPRWAPRRRCA